MANGNNSQDDLGINGNNTSIRCQFGGCNVEITHSSESVALAMFQSHVLTHQMNPTATSTQRLPPIQRPEVKQDITEEDMDSFQVE